MVIPTQFNTGAFIPTTTLFDVSEIYNIDVKSPEFKELIVRLYQGIANMAQVINVAEKGYYVRNEFVTGSLMFPNPVNTSLTAVPANERQVVRMTVNFGALPNAAIKSVPHNIPVTPAFTFLKIYGAATRPSTFGVPSSGSFLPLPYVSSLGLNQSIELFADSTDVNITTGSDYSLWTGYVVLEYIKS